MGHVWMMIHDHVCAGTVACSVAWFAQGMSHCRCIIDMLRCSAVYSIRVSLPLGPPHWSYSASTQRKHVHKPKMFPTPPKHPSPPRFAETRITQGGPKNCTVKWSCIYCTCCLVCDDTLSTHCVQVNINDETVWFCRVFRKHYASEHINYLLRFVGLKNSKTTHWPTHPSRSCYLSFHRRVVHGKRQERQIIGTSPYTCLYRTW